MDMDTSKDSWNACLQYRNKQLTKQLKGLPEGFGINKMFFFFDSGNGTVVVSPSKAFLWHN